MGKLSSAIEKKTNISWQDILIPQSVCFKKAAGYRISQDCGKVYGQINYFFVKNDNNILTIKYATLYNHLIRKKYSKRRLL